MMHWNWLPVVRRGVLLMTVQPCHLGISSCIVNIMELFGVDGPVGYSTLEFAMNIELDEVVVQDVSDDALELAAGGAQGGQYSVAWNYYCG